MVMVDGDVDWDKEGNGDGYEDERCMEMGIPNQYK